MLSVIKSAALLRARSSAGSAHAQKGRSKKPVSKMVASLAFVVAAFMDTITALFSFAITVTTIGASATINFGVGAFGCATGAAAGATGFVAGPAGGVAGVVFGCLGGIAAAQFAGSVITAAIGPLGALIGIAFNISIAATFGTFLFFMLHGMGLFRPRLLLGGGAEFIPILNNLPFWTLMTLFAIVGARKEGGGGFSSFGADSSPRALAEEGGQEGQGKKERDSPSPSEMREEGIPEKRSPKESAPAQSERSRMIDGITRGVPPNDITPRTASDRA